MKILHELVEDSSLILRACPFRGVELSTAVILVEYVSLFHVPIIPQGRVISSLERVF
jgi:hypothetical protein